MPQSTIRTNLWSAVHNFFEQNDGSLPEILLVGVSPEQAQAIFDALLQHAHPLRDDQTVWVDETVGDVPIRDLADAPLLAAQRQLAGWLHVVLTGVRTGGTDLPDLGVGIANDHVSLDYRPGPGWTADSLAAFVDLLRGLQQLAPKSQLVLADDGSHPLPDDAQRQFRQAIETYGAQT
jgi:hypothetical protein